MQFVWRLIENYSWLLDRDILDNEKWVDIFKLAIGNCQLKIHLQNVQQNGLCFVL